MRSRCNPAAVRRARDRAQRDRQGHCAAQDHQTWDGASINYPAGQAEVTSLMIEIAPGGETTWHEHPVPSFGVLLEGTLEVSLADGKTKLIKPGEALAEVISTAHNGRNVGKGPVKLIVFYAGAVGKPVTVQRPDAKPKAN